MQKVFDNIQVLRNTFTNNLRGRNRYTNRVGETVNDLGTPSYRSYTSAGTSDATEYTTIANFLVEMDGAQVSKEFAQNCFKDYDEMVGKLDNETKYDASNAGA